MKALAELTVAAALAMGLHVAGFALTRSVDEGASAGGGAGGGDVVSLQAANADIAALVKEWERPPEVSQVVAPDPPLGDDLPVPTLAPETAPLAQVVALPQPADPDTPPAPEAAPEPPKTQDPPPRPQRRPDPPKAEPAKPTSQGSRQATVAAGMDGQEQAGAGQGDSVATEGTATARAAWMGAIRSRIERSMRYPRGADGATGTVLVQVEVAPGGALQAVGIAKSSGNAVLDKAALAIVRDAAPFRRAPRDAGDAPARFKVPLTFRR